MALPIASGRTRVPRIKIHDTPIIRGHNRGQAKGNETRGFFPLWKPLSSLPLAQAVRRPHPPVSHWSVGSPLLDAEF